MLAWYQTGNHITADVEGGAFTPEQLCLEVEDDYGDFTSEHCAITAPFTGSWYQPPYADSYDVLYRFSASDTGVGWCGTISSLSMTEPFAIAQVNGAAALASGAAIVIAAMY